MGDTYDVAEFRRLQTRLADLWPLSLRSDQPRTLVVISSITAAPLPEHFCAIIPAYEERYLFFVLAAARCPNTRVIYVTSQAIPPRVVDYYLHLVPGVSAEELRRRTTLISVGDWSRRPLVNKVLDRPRLLERIRTLMSDRRGVLVPFIATESEAQLALRLGIPMYGPDPALAELGTKSGSRRIFAAAGVPCPVGVEGIRDRHDLVEALVELQRRYGVQEAIVKLDFLGGGLGNAAIRLEGISNRAHVERRVDELQRKTTRSAPKRSSRCWPPAASLRSG